MAINTTSTFSGVTLAMIGTYVNGTIKGKDIDRVERAINSSDEFREVYDRKMREKEFILQLIPAQVATASTLKSIKKEMAEINTNVYSTERETLGKRVVRFLTTPIIEL